ncbi:MAG: hypothetical protein RL596_874 [Bacteroidota bacterium]|jgi:hypothetical protein
MAKKELETIIVEQKILSRIYVRDFMFTLTAKEFENLRSQVGTSSWGGTRYMPMAFTEQGVAMLSSILSSKVAIDAKPAPRNKIGFKHYN